jgi:hypothetical protein
MRQPVTTQMGVFVDWGYMRYLKCHQTEGAFSEDLYFTAGALSRNRLVDLESLLENRSLAYVWRCTS